MTAPLKTHMPDSLTFKKLEDLQVAGRRVFVRTDFNVPLKKEPDSERIVVADDTRLREALPTIEWLCQAGARVVLASHLGRPAGRFNPALSLEPVGARLSELLNREIVFSGECRFDQVRHLVNGLKAGGVLLLENLRFSEGEERNSAEFCRQLSQFTDVYINDAFGSIHRAHASTVGLPSIIAEKGIGRLIEVELNAFETALGKPARPFLLILGGAKLSDKLPVVEHLLEKIDLCCIGGAMAYTFLHVLGRRVGKSPVDRSHISTVSRILDRAERLGVTLYFPYDHRIALDLKEEGVVEVTPTVDIPEDWSGYDVGPLTIERWGKVIREAGTIIWNGPLGVFEQERFSNGTREIAKAVAEGRGYKIVGGGDSLAALHQSGYSQHISHCSTGGGAMLKLLSGAPLPALKVLHEALL